MSYYALYIPLKNGAAGGSSSGNGCNTSPATSTSIGQGGDLLRPYLVGDGVGEATVDGQPFVFRKKIDALKVLKMYKDARLREFSNADDAVNYAQTGYEVVHSKYNDVKTSTAAAEKAIFRAPTKQELIQFRKIIEDGDYESVKTMIWDNPRYLVSSGDTPTALKEGYRYNALHVCAISKQPRIAELILQTVSDPNFVDLLTGKKNDMNMCKELASNLLDYYLNIPEKGRSETPLHLAAKNGAVEVVEVLTSYSMCKMTRNSDNKLPSEIICSRMPIGYGDAYRKISTLMEELFYVPVIRSVDNAIPPQIGQPFSTKNPPNLNFDPLSPEVKIQALAGPMNKDDAKQFCRRWKTPPRHGSNTSSPIANNIFITSPNRASTPAKTPQSNRSFETPKLQRRNLFDAGPPTPYPGKHHNGLNSTTDELELSLNENYAIDKQNGNHSHRDSESPITPKSALPKRETNNNEKEHHGVNNSISQHSFAKPNMLRSALCPSTPLMREKKDIFFTYREQYVASPVVFEQSDEFRNTSITCERDIYDSPGFKERHIKITDTEKGLEVIGRELAKAQDVEWREYWDFLDEFIDIASQEGLQKLEQFFAKRVREAEVAKKASQVATHSAVMFDDVCIALEKYGFCKDGGDTIDGGRNGIYERTRYDQGTHANNVNAPQSTTPYTCVEKSLQVFAKRMTKTISNNIENIVSINDAFLSELKRLKSLICSFKEDYRFLNVNFSKVHGRFANLIANYLKHSQDLDTEAKPKILKCLQHILLSPGERKEQLYCVCKKVIAFLENSTEQILPENLKTEAMCSNAWLAENECECQWETNLSHKASRRNRKSEARYMNHQHDIAVKKQIVRDKNEKIAKAAGNFHEYRNPQPFDSDDDAEEDVFWSDFGGSETEEEDEVWLTPPESPSDLELVQKTPEKNSYNIFICGTEPTKRDIDVLNAIGKGKFGFPNIHKWKTAVLRHYNLTDSFPSPIKLKLKIEPEPFDYNWL